LRFSRTHPFSLFLADNEVLSFLTVYRMVANASDLLEKMDEVWTEQKAMYDRARLELLKRRVFKFCSLWLSQYGETDFVSRRVSKQLVRFSGHLSKSDANRVKLSLLQAQKRASARAFELDLSLLSKNEDGSPGKLQTSELMAVEVYSARMIAQQLTVIDSVLFRRLQPSEFMKQRWLKNKDLAPSLSRLASRFNQVSFWVGTCVVEDRKPRMQARVIKRFIGVAEELYRMGNFNSLGAVVAGLNNSSVQRLKRAWVLVSRRRVSLFEQLEDLLSPLYNFRNYHDAFRERLPPRIPYVAIYLRGILFAGRSCVFLV
jgi:RasGEF domain